MEASLYQCHFSSVNLRPKMHEHENEFTASKDLGMNAWEKLTVNRVRVTLIYYNPSEFVCEHLRRDTPGCGGEWIEGK
jgi:hypothetical protein